VPCVVLIANLSAFPQNPRVLTLNCCTLDNVNVIGVEIANHKSVLDLQKAIKTNLNIRGIAEIELRQVGLHSVAR
jgi:hypothetical protein